MFFVCILHTAPSGANIGGVTITGRRPMDECIAREGHPYGRYTIMWKVSIKSAAVRGLRSNHVKLCGIKIINNNCEIIASKCTCRAMAIRLLNI